VVVRTGSCGAVSTWTVDSNIIGLGGAIFYGAVGSCVTTVSVWTGSCGSMSTWTVDFCGTTSESTIGYSGKRIRATCSISFLPIVSLVDLVDLVFLLGKVEMKVVVFFFHF
jgi:hypothetical protein